VLGLKDDYDDGQESSSSSSAPVKSGHIGSNLPPDVLKKFLAKAKGLNPNDDADLTKLDDKNKGHQMLAKMGWKEGQGLGRTKTGRVEPVKPEIRFVPSSFLLSCSPHFISFFF
jgi:hypothetical protein